LTILKLTGTVILFSLLSSGSLFTQEELVSPGDKISVRIEEDPSYGGIFTVSANGQVILPLINEVRAAGSSREGLAQKIKERLEEKFYRKATVLVSILEKAPKRLPYYERSEGDTGFYVTGEAEIIGEVWVTGEVMREGPVPIYNNKKLTVTKAIILCGGFKEFANQRRVIVRRKDKKGKWQEIPVNVAAIKKKGLLDQDIELQDGDEIYVPQSFFNF